MPISIFQKPKPPREVSEADRLAYERKQEEAFNKLPRWRRLLTGDVPGGIMKGLFGEPPAVRGWKNMDDSDKTNMVIQSILTMAPIMGMTKYLGAGRVPNVAARTAATGEFVNAGRNISPGTHIAAEAFAAKYPRIAAHMQLENINHPKHLGTTGFGLGESPTKYRVGINPSLIDKQGVNPLDTMAHEGTHVAQQLGLGESDFAQLYSSANKASGYANNPFEQTARDIGRKNVLMNNYPDIKSKELRVRNTRKELAKTVSSLPAGDENRRDMASIILKRGNK